jgi:hypothetical protein
MSPSDRAAARASITATPAISAARSAPATAMRSAPDQMIRSTSSSRYVTSSALTCWDPSTRTTRTSTSFPPSVIASAASGRSPAHASRSTSAALALRSRERAIALHSAS